MADNNDATTYTMKYTKDQFEQILDNVYNTQYTNQEIHDDIALIFNPAIQQDNEGE